MLVQTSFDTGANQFWHWGKPVLTLGQTSFEVGENQFDVGINQFWNWCKVVLTLVQTSFDTDTNQFWHWY